MEPSIFTKIINREIPAHIIYEDGETLAFLDIRPASDGHALVVPKQQVDHFDDLDDDTYQAVMQTVKTVSQRIRNTLNPQRVGLVVFGFDVPHAHVHVIPLYQGNEIAIKHIDPSQASNEKLADVAAKLRDSS